MPTDSFQISEDHWRAALRAAGLKCTVQRLAVLRHLAAATRPLSHREVLESLDGLCREPTTVFRNLNDLSECALVNRIDVGDHIWRFELRGGVASSNGQHPHFLCVTCGAITCLHEVSVMDAGRRLKVPAGLEVVDEVLLKGRCLDCQQKTA